MRINKIISTFTVFVCVVTFAGCGGKASSNFLSPEPFADTSVLSSSWAERNNTGEKSESVYQNETTGDTTQGESSSPFTENNTSAETLRNDSPAVASDSPAAEPSAGAGSEAMPTVNIQAGSKTFTVILYNNASAQALLAKMPLTLNMDELNGNEKYYYLPDSLPTDPHRVENISTGDLMLYGSDCLVLFYKSFYTSYSYTRLGYVKDVSGLADALGSGSIQVTFGVGG